MRIAVLTTDNREHFKDYRCRRPYFGTAPEALLQGFALLPEVEVHVISCVRQPVSSPEKLADNIWCHSLVVPKSGWMATSYQGCIRAVRSKFKAVRPDVVHGQGTERDCAIEAVFSGFPNVLTIHGNMRLIAQLTKSKPLSFNWINAHLEGWTIPRSDGVVCITNYTREAVKGDSKRTWVVPNAVDTSFLALGEKRMEKYESAVTDAKQRPGQQKVKSDGAINEGNLSPSHLHTFTPLTKIPIILVVANVDERKNQNAFIRALDPLAKKMSFEVRFFGGCGTSDCAREFRELIASRPWCHYGGMLGREELRTQFEQADMLALPTREDNCPMVVLEAMASGVPVMASKVGGVPDLIDGVRTGLFCDPSQPRSFVDGVERLLNDRDFAGKLARQAHDEAVTRFHPRVIAARHLEIYREVIGR
jgi:glycosyltransferase involved in cell wall biosynthesis